MTRNDLNSFLKEDKKQTIGNLSVKNICLLIVTNSSVWKRWKFIVYMRKQAYYRGLFESGNPIYLLPMLYYLRKRNILGRSLGFEIGGANIGKGLALYHNGSIIINNKTIIGNYCRLHGDNCIGNNGITDDCPVIGNNVDIGIGAKIIGPVTIADNITIGAGAVVHSSFLEPNVTIAGVPAKVIKKIH